MAATTQKRRVFSTFNLTRMAVLTALATILYLTLEIPVIPPMYKLDFSNVPVLLGAFAMGIEPGLLILVMKNVIHVLIKGLGSTMGIGNLADLVTTTAYLIPACLLYRRQKTRKGALKGMILGSICQVIVAVLVNWLVMIPFYQNAFHMSIESIVGMATQVLPFVDTEAEFYFLACAPFNLLKVAVLSLITFLIYKPLSPLLHEKV
ncbi:MAG: ECF transporter S component [Clostridia bacterium]|nr:ECF transporter S component [Clostridia bacterium]